MIDTRLNEFDNFLIIGLQAKMTVKPLSPMNLSMNLLIFINYWIIGKNDCQTSGCETFLPLLST